MIDLKHQTREPNKCNASPERLFSCYPLSLYDLRYENNDGSSNFRDNVSISCRELYKISILRPRQSAISTKAFWILFMSSK